MPWRKSLAPRLSAPLCAALASLSFAEAKCLTEIRIRTGAPIRMVFTVGEKVFGDCVNEKEMDALLAALSAHSRYAYESQMASGYIPLPGGHRAGVCGRVVYENGIISRMSAITSVCIRISRDIQDASLPIRSYLFISGRPSRVLLLGPPGSGKTTVLRDTAKYLSKTCALHVAAADEREELSADGEWTEIDVMRGADKSDAVMMLVRSMSPQVLICDELGNFADAHAMLHAASCGVGVIASAHADSFSDLSKRPWLSVLFERRMFDWYLLLAPVGRLSGAMDAQGKEHIVTLYGKS